MEYISLDKIAVFKQGKQVPIDKQSLVKKDNMVRFVRIVDYTNTSEPPRYIEDFGERYWVDKSDIVMIRYGSQTAGTIVRGIPGIIANNMFQVDVQDQRFNVDFMFYYLSSSEIKHMLMNGQSSSTMPAITFGMMKQIMVPIFSLEDQNRVASILQQIENKINLNTKINNNLEQQAQAYFNELFVTNADPLWAEGTLSDIGSIVAGGTPSKSKTEYYTDHGIAWITPKDLSNDKSKYISHGEIDISELGFSKSSATKMPKGTVLFSSRAPIGYIAIAQNEVTTNQGFKSVVPNENIGTAFVYFLLKQLLPTIENMASGSTFKEISGSGMKSVPVVIPDDATIRLFNDFCLPLFKEQEALEAENRRLANLRDTLLPKLMSGEIDVSDVDI
ncbi:restriction endonuclease subunit S [Coprococcus catus]|uniref:restriction endonuclease subunit S n=1 Tax=Coprococcus catus TaxID=116085 RepID=UPI0020976B0E|nr:restriction endonuclease subunit S [Coprococcus catus]MCO7146941.1 restriction endonuclease subunit S [Coprococcus catus]